MDLHFKAALESNFLHKKNERISRNFFNRYSNILFMRGNMDERLLGCLIGTL